MIDVNRVDAILTDCFFKPEEIEDGAPKDEQQLVKAEGIMTDFGFHRDRLESHREEVKAMLEQLPVGFNKSNGGGGSFMGMCETERGEQWTGEQRRMEQLLVLGIGLGLAKYCVPKPMWSMLPGGMPYVCLDLE